MFCYKINRQFLMSFFVFLFGQLYRYLATGNSFQCLAFSFRLGVCTVQRIVRSTCKVLWEKLQPGFMPKPDEEMWKQSSEDFYAKWNFPNCVGAIDGKHIRIKKPFLSGAKYWNYKGFCSVVLLAVADAYGRFLAIDVGSYGSCSDGGIFRASQFGQLLMDGRLGLPAPRRIPQTEHLMPSVFVADEAFPLLVNLMKPFPRRNMTLEERVFNYRLSRARRQVECSFGILSNTWRILLKAIETSVGPALDTVKATCVLHNVLLAQEPGRLFETSQCNNSNSTNSTTRQEIVISSARTACQEAIDIRKTVTILCPQLEVFPGKMMLA